MRYVILLSAVMNANVPWRRHTHGRFYVQPLKALTGLQQGPVSGSLFTAFYFIFPLTMMLAGTILPKVGPRVCAMGGWISLWQWAG